MKKSIIVFLIISSAFCCMVTALAGSIPEDLLGSDDALVFFGKVISYDGDIRILPTQTVKGDIKIEKELSYDEACPMGRFSIKKGKTYLFGYFDNNNPLYVFLTSSTDVNTLKILNKSGGGQEERMQSYLNKGDFSRAEAARILKTSPNSETALPNAESHSSSRFYILLGISIFIAIFISVAFIIFKKSLRPPKNI